MSESANGFNSESFATGAQPASPTEDVESPQFESPQFGLVDVIEAFTAMRHEWRGQTKESRAVATTIESAVVAIQDLRTKLLAQTADEPAGDARRLAHLLAETDHQLTRAVQAIRQTELNRRQRDEGDVCGVREYFISMNALARWFARPLLAFILEQRQEGQSSTEDPAIEGLDLILARLRRAMEQQHIERLDAVGQVFDASTMNAIGTVVSDEYPAGHVVEQLSPGYRWRGQVLKFAEVRVTADAA